MKVLAVHPSALMYTKIYLRLEPLGLENSWPTSDTSSQTRAVVPDLLMAIEHDRTAITRVPAWCRPSARPPPRFVESLDAIGPARDLLRHRRKYFIGVLDPCASIEFARGCPWDCSFSSAWTFYGRNYRVMSPEKAVEDLGRLKEPWVFILDDVAFIQGKHGMAIGEAISSADKRIS